MMTVANYLDNESATMKVASEGNLTLVAFNFGKNSINLADPSSDKISLA